MNLYAFLSRLNPFDRLFVYIYIILYILYIVIYMYNLYIKSMYTYIRAHERYFFSPFFSVCFIRSLYLYLSLSINRSPKWSQCQNTTYAAYKSYFSPFVDLYDTATDAHHLLIQYIKISVYILYYILVF